MNLFPFRYGVGTYVGGDEILSTNTHTWRN